MSSPHPDDDMLERYALQPETIADADELESHLRDCTKCGEFVAAVKAFEQHLANPETWQIDATLTGEKRAPRGITDGLRDLRIEDEEGAYLLDPIVGSPVVFERANIQEDRRYFTAGVVRRLARASADAREDQPRHALRLAQTAVFIAERLSSASYDRDLIADLRGTAWRECANALRYLGRNQEALMAIDRGADAFREAPAPEFDLARLTLIRGTVFVNMGHLGEALSQARQCSLIFKKYGDVQRKVDAGFLEGGTLFVMKELRAALALFLALEEPIAELDDPSTRARLANNLAAVYQELQLPQLAAPYFREAIVLYEHLGFEIEKLRTEWNLALLALQSPGNREDALARLRRVAVGFETRGSLGDAALVKLDVAEQQVLAEEYDEVVDLCRELIEQFMSAGMLASAITALQYLRDAAAVGRATSSDVGHIRTFLTRLKREPELLFAPPPAAT